MGGGFGGCTHQPVQEEAVDALSGTVPQAYQNQFAITPEGYVMETAGWNLLVTLIQTFPGARTGKSSLIQSAEVIPAAAKTSAYPNSRVEIRSYHSEYERIRNPVILSDPSIPAWPIRHPGKYAR